MPDNLPNNRHAHSPRNVFEQQSHMPNAQQPLRGVGQDKSVLTFNRIASSQPASLKKGMQSHKTRTINSRSQKQSSDKRRLTPFTIQISPVVKAEVERIAELEHLSLSTVGRTAIEEWIHWKIHSQHEALLYPKLRQIIREERQASDNRIVFFLMRIAFAAEQSRILITNVLDRVLRLLKVPEQTFTNLVDQSSRMARRNIIQKSPLIKTLFEEWEGSVRDTREEDISQNNG